MAIQFPLNPVDGDEFNAVGRRFRYTSPPGVWESIGSQDAESDPIFSASPAAGITSTEITSWNEAYSWGDHATAGYLTSYTETDTLDSVTGRGATTTNAVTVGNLTSTGIDDNATSNQFTLTNSEASFGGILKSNGGYLVTGTVYGILANGQFTSIGIDDNAISTALTIDSSQNVSIAGDLSISNTPYPRITLSDATTANDKAFIDHSAGELVITSQNNSNNGSITFKGFNGSGLTNYMNINSGGQVTIYDDLTVNGAFTSTGIDDNATSTALTIDSSQNVGIGGDPKEKLHVITASNSLGTVADASADELVLENTGDTGMTFLSPNTATQTIAFGDTDNRLSGWIEYDHSSNSMAFGTVNASSERIRITSSGKVGIGETNPESILHITGSSPKLLIEASNNDKPRIEFNREASVVNWRYVNDGAVFKTQWGDDSTAWNETYRVTSGYNHYWNTDQLTLTSSGNVGIGTDGPNEKLSLRGSGSATSLYVYDGAGSTAGRFTSSGDIIDISARGSVNSKLTVTTGAGAGSTAMTIASNGNVGIGESGTLRGKLHIDGGTTDIPFYFDSNTQAYPVSGFGGALTYNHTAGSARVNFWNTWSGATGSQGGFDFRRLTGASSSTSLMTINGNGNVGIGTSNPACALHINPASPSYTPVAYNASVAQMWSRGGGGVSLQLATESTGAGSIYFTDNAANTSPGYIQYNHAVPEFVIGTEGTRKITIAGTTGNVGIGETNPTSAKLVAYTTSALRAAVFNAAAATTAYQQMIAFQHQGTDMLSLTTGPITTLAEKNSGFILESPTYLGFRVNAAERMRIDSNGNLLIGKTAASSITVGPQLLPTGVFNSGIAASTNSTITNTIYSTTAAATRFYVGMGGTIFATSTSITAISDASLKENVRDLDKGLESVKALKPRRYDWKNGDGTDVMGFIAQEVEEVMPELVYDYQYTAEETKKGLKMGDMLPSMVKAIQELAQQVEDLQAELAALKSTGEA